MFRTARGFKLTDQPRITDHGYCPNTDPRGMFTYASVEALVNCKYNTDLRYCLNTQYGTGQTYASYEALALTLCTVALWMN